MSFCTALFASNEKLLIKSRQVVLYTGEAFNCSKLTYKESAERYMLWRARALTPGEEEV